MLQIKPTENYGGVEISGDYNDLENLYEALHQIVGEDGEHKGYDDVRIRVLGLCYDVRYAFMGRRELFFADHGVSEEALKWHQMIATQKNLYLSFKTYYPELLFIVMALDQFIGLYQEKANYPSRDKYIATVRLFQAEVVESLGELLTDRGVSIMLGHMNKCASFNNYFTQYIDELNDRFFRWDKEKRLKNISIIAKRIADQGKEYQTRKQEIMEAASEYNCLVSEIQYSMEYPDEDFEW